MQSITYFLRVRVSNVVSVRLCVELRASLTNWGWEEVVKG